MGKFAGWNFLGSSAFMLNTQGVNMLMNIYFGVAANAARGIAVQVDSAVKSFANSFTTAINPQITKSYSAGELDYMYQLVCRGEKFSAFVVKKDMKDFELDTCRLTEDERQIILDGCLINYYKNH